MSRKLKVVWVVTVPYVVKYHLLNTLKRMPSDFEVCVVGQEVSQFRDTYPDVKWVDININRRTSPFADLWALFQLCRFFLAYEPDIVHSLMPKSGLLASIAGRICRVPVRIHTFTGQVWATKGGLGGMVLRITDRLINTLNTVCLTDSRSQSSFLHENKISFKGEPLPVLLHGSLSGVDVDRFNLPGLADAADQLRSSLKIGREHFVFAYIARKTRDKGAIDVLKAFNSVLAAFPNARLLFVGPDELGEIAPLRNTNPELFVNVIDVGEVSNHEVYLAISEVLCLPSYREGFGSIVIDAAALGIPAIGSRIPGLTDSIVDGQTGMLFPVGNLDELVKLMLAFAENPAMRRELGSRAKARVDEFFTANRLYAATRELYLKCASDNRAIRNKRDGLS